MTSQMCIANQVGVSLASDSVVSFGNTGRFYSSVNKIFSLGARQPVGIMISGSAISPSTGLPWERIIGKVRENVGVDEKERLREYFDAFQSTLVGLTESFHNNLALQDDLISYFTEQVFTHAARKEKLRSEFRGEVEFYVPEVTSYFNEGTEQRIDEIFEMAESEMSVYMVDKPQNRDEKYAKDWYDMVTDFHGQPINEAASLFCERHELEEKLEKIQTIFLYHCLKYGREQFWKTKTKIVISGFGKHDLYPIIINFTSTCIVGEFTVSQCEGHYIRKRNISDNGEIRREPKEDFSILNSNISGGEPEMLQWWSASSFMIPYAIQDEMNTLINGISPQIEYHLRNTLPDMMTNGVEGVQESIIDIIQKSLPEIEGKASFMATIRENLDNDSVNLEIKNCIGRYINFVSRRNNFRTSVSLLPINEITDMARHLVSTESNLMHWTSPANAVGGPIDVAQITKEDGFLWVDTKQVFDTSKNPRMMDINRYSSNLK